MLGEFLAGVVATGLMFGVLWLAVEAWDGEAEMRRQQVERVVATLESRP